MLRFAAPAAPVASVPSAAPYASPVPTRHAASKRPAGKAAIAALRADGCRAQPATTREARPRSAQPGRSLRGGSLITGSRPRVAALWRGLSAAAHRQALNTYTNAPGLITPRAPDYGTPRVAPVPPLACLLAIQTLFLTPAMRSPGRAREAVPTHRSRHLLSLRAGRLRQVSRPLLRPSPPLRVLAQFQHCTRTSKGDGSRPVARFLPRLSRRLRRSARHPAFHVPRPPPSRPLRHSQLRGPHCASL